jgi:ABC-type nitrate/sulfonate/bicarbonate transport system substrate-binding protein
MKTKTVIAALLTLGSLAAQPAMAQSPAAPLEFNYGYTTADHVNLYVAQDLGLFEQAGLKPKFFTFPSGAPLLAALKSESLDVVTAGLGFAFALGQKIPVTMLFWNSNDSTGEGLVVDAKSGIKSFQDIGKAQKIGAASGTCAQVALYLLAKKVGLDYGKLNVVNLPAPLFRNSFLSNSIDAGIAWSPYSITLDAEGYKVVSWDTEYTPPGGLCPRTTAARPAFLKAHPEIGVKLLQVDAMASAAIAKNPQLGIDAIAKRLSLPAPVAKATFERVYLQRPTYAQQLDPASPYSMTSKDGGLAAKYLLATQVLYETKSIPEPVPMSVIQEAIDPTYLKQYSTSAPKK